MMTREAVRRYCSTREMVTCVVPDIVHIFQAVRNLYLAINRVTFAQSGERLICESV